MAKREPTAPVMEDLPGEKTQAQRLAELDYEAQAAQIGAGQAERTYGAWGPLWRLARRLEGFKGKHRFRKKTYLWLMLFTGWLGGHRYYQGRWKLALLYTAFCWTGIPLALCVTDFMEVMPLPADGDGCVVL